VFFVQRILFLANRNAEFPVYNTTPQSYSILNAGASEMLKNIKNYSLEEMKNVYKSLFQETLN